RVLRRAQYWQGSGPDSCCIHAPIIPAREALRQWFSIIRRRQSLFAYLSSRLFQVVSQSILPFSSPNNEPLGVSKNSRLRACFCCPTITRRGSPCSGCLAALRIT